MNNWSVILYVLLGGCAGALQARVLGNVEAKVGLLGNMLVNFLFGFLFTLLIISVYSLFQYQNPFKYYYATQWVQVKPWELSAGIFGIIIVTSIGMGASRIGISATLLLFIFSQLLLGVAMDHFGWMGGEAFAITPSKIAGIAAMCLGMYLFFR